MIPIPSSAMALLLTVVVSASAGAYLGFDYGTSKQKAADQHEIDKVNKVIAENKVKANAAYRAEASKVIALQSQLAAFKYKLEKSHVQNQETTNRLRDAYSAYGLRFRVEDDARRWGSGSGPSTTEGSTPGDEGAKIVQLPEEITRNLRQLSFEADQLNDDYKLCYGYVNR